MSNGLNRTKREQSNAGAEITGELIEYLLAVTVAVVCVAVPLYAKDAYDQIGNAKFAVYKTVVGTGFSVLLALAALYGCFRLREVRSKDQKKSGGKRRLSATDWLVCVYLLLTTMSVISGGFYEDALWGSFGWNMGLVSQISFVLLYLFCSRFGKYYREMLAVMCAAAAAVFLIGILHRVGADPIGFYRGLTDSQRAEFLSTVGQASWYGSYLAVVLPVGAAVFLYADKAIWRAAGGIYTALGFCTLVTQNSDSVYFAFAGFMLVFFWVSAESREGLFRFAILCALFLGSGKLMYFLMRIRPNPALVYDPVTRIVLCSGLTWVLFGSCLILCAVLYQRRGRAYAAESMLWVRRAALAVTGAALFGAILLIVLQSKGILPGEMAERLSKVSYFNWNDDWGNGRGRIWRFAAGVFAGESLPRKLVGVGPDCLSSYVAAYHAEEAEMFWGQKVLTNAHNEWLNILISGGILGAAAYIGIYVTAAGRFLRARRRDILLTGAAASAVSYMAYNFFCYQQVCCTPFVFILMGLGEYILSHTDRSSVESSGNVC